MKQSRKMEMFNKKKALIGVGVLLIFLSTILAASITAGVLIRSTGVLQQKAVEVEETVRERLITGIEVVTANARGDTSVGNVKYFEFYVRLKAGSSAVRLSDTALTVATDDIDLTAEFSDPFEGSQTTQIGLISETVNESVIDLDSDGIGDTIHYIKNMSGIYDGLQVQFSGGGTFNYSLGLDLSGASSTTGVILKYSDVPIVVSGSTLGYIFLSGTVMTDDTLTNDEVEFYVSTSSFTCDFATLTPEVTYCGFPQVGNTDDSVNAGELIVLRFALATGHELSEGDLLQLQFIPREGELTSLDLKVPNTIKTKMKLI